ncbi:MAG: zinc ABC transporter substrate-binding protein [Verrucomicrobiota bacterium]
MKKILIGIGLLIGAIGLSGCAENTQGEKIEIRYPYKIVATIGMVADIVREVAGEQAEVRGLIGEGVDPHLYNPTTDDVKAMIAADVVFYSGLMLEGKMGDTFVKVARTGKSVWAVTEEIEERYLLKPPGFDGHFDPHVWMDVEAWMKAVEVVQKALSEYDPSHAKDYEARAAAYIAGLHQLHDYAVKSIASIPESGRVMISAHDAFNYFGRAYGLEVEGVQGLTTESEAGIGHINQLKDKIVERDIKAVFVESSVSDKSVQSLVDGAKSVGRDVAKVGPLFSDAMGASGTYEGTYIGMIDHNVTMITRALGGQAPEKGMQGRLTEQKLH